MVVVGAKDQRANIQEKLIFSIFREADLFVIRVVVYTGQSETEDAIIIHKNPQFIISVSKLRKLKERQA